MFSLNKYQTNYMGCEELIFDPSTDTNSQRMELEVETQGNFTPQNKSKEIQFSSTESPQNQEIHSKDCLKFCRKISTLVMNHLKVRSDLIVDILRFNAEVINCLLYLFDIENVDLNHLIDIQAECLLDIWDRFKEHMSYSKNKKICIVKQEYWDLIFEKTACIEELKKTFDEINETLKSLAGGKKTLLDDNNFCNLLAPMLYCTNKLITLIVLTMDSSERAFTVRSLATFDNFEVLIIFPQLFKHYNHRRGKFARECCRKCKICGSRTLPTNFLETLKESRHQTMQILSYVKKLVEEYDFSSFTTLVNLLDVFYKLP